MPVSTNGDDACTADIYSRNFTIQLDELLGTRAFTGCWPENPAVESPDTTLVPNCESVMAG